MCSSLSRLAPSLFRDISALRNIVTFARGVNLEEDAAKEKRMRRKRRNRLVRHGRLMNINELQRTDFGPLASQVLYCKCKCQITLL